MFTIWKPALPPLVILLFCSACGSDGSAPTPAPTPPPGNTAPVITSATTASSAERNTDVFYTATATDADGNTLTFSVSGGSDAGLFFVDGATGDLSFTRAPDFENPTDANTDNIYEVTLSASDGTATTTLNLSVTINDVTGMPIITSRIATGLSRPVYVTGAGDGSGRLFIVEQRGQIKIFDLNAGQIGAAPFLDLTSSLSTGSEQGLLGMAFAPDFATSGLFYVNITNTNGDTEIVEFEIDPANENLADTTSRRLILGIDQPAGNHNAGWIGFGPDNMLYVPTGDGGGGGDPSGNSQNTNNLLGAILRIDPTGDDFPADANANYAVPAGNPLVGTAGRDEIWAYGLRNPFRASFDRMNGNFYIGDVGQGAVEEIDLLPLGTSGQNYGWNVFEGTQPFTGPNPGGLTPPIAEYDHVGGATGGFSVTGGYVHRGSVAALSGEYIFADFVSGNIWSLPTASIAQGATIAANNFILRNTDIGMPEVGTINDISSFGEDDDGEMYVVELTNGEVYRIESEP